MTTDKGLKKALGKQSSYRLPSNFTYRMMQQVREEAFARERRRNTVFGGHWLYFVCAHSVV